MKIHIWGFAKNCDNTPRPNSLADPPNQFNEFINVIKPEVSENSWSRKFSTRVSFIFSRSTTRNDSLDLVSKHENNNMKSRSRLKIREWLYDNLHIVSPGESKKDNSQSRLEKLHLFSRMRVRPRQSCLKALSVCIIKNLSKNKIYRVRVKKQSKTAVFEFHSPSFVSRVTGS